MYARQAMIPMNSGARPQRTLEPGHEPPATPPTSRNRRRSPGRAATKPTRAECSQSRKPFRMAPLTTRPKPRKTQPISPIRYRMPANNCPGQRRQQQVGGIRSFQPGEPE